MGANTDICGVINGAASVKRIPEPGIVLRVIKKRNSIERGWGDLDWSRAECDRRG